MGGRDGERLKWMGEDRNDLPEEKAVRVFELRVLGLGEAVLFARAGDPEDVLETVAQAVGGAGGVDEVGREMFVFRGFGVEGRHLVEIEAGEALVEEVDGGGVAGFVRVGFHDLVGDFHVREGVEHGDFALQHVVVVDHGGFGAAEDVWDGRVVLVGEVFDGGRSGCLVFVLGQ